MVSPGRHVVELDLMRRLTGGEDPSIGREQRAHPNPPNRTWEGTDPASRSRLPRSNTRTHPVAFVQETSQRLSGLNTTRAHGSSTLSPGGSDFSSRRSGRFQT